MSQKTFIQDCIEQNDLSQLDYKDMKEISNQIEVYYSTLYTETELTKLKIFFNKFADENGFPSNFRATKVKLVKYANQFYFVNMYNQFCFIDDIDNEIKVTPLLTKVNGSEYRLTYKDIISNSSNKIKWKNKVYSKDTYNCCDNYTFDNICAVSVYENEILNMISNDSRNVRDIDLLIQTIQIGGRKAECYAEDFDTYIMAGFTPISICKWDDDLAPMEWKRANGFSKNDNSWKQKSDENFMVHRQDIIFWIYTDTTPDLTLKQFLDKVGYSDSYEEAQTKRNTIYNKFLEGN